MIQYYINSRPVPRAIARHHLCESLNGVSIETAQEILKQARQTDIFGKNALKLLADHGISIHNTNEVKNG